MDETNPTLREEMKKVVRNQIRQNDPPETKQTYERLIREGFPIDEVMRQLAAVVTFNQERYIKRLNNLPNR